MTARADLIAEVRELFDEGWCICRSASLGERVLEALIEAEDTAAWGVKNVETGAITRIPGWHKCVGCRREEREMSALTRQIAAMTRLLIDSGDLTPMGKRQIENVLKQHTDDQKVPTTRAAALPGTDKEN